MVEAEGTLVPRTRVAVLVLGVLAAVVALTLWGAAPAGAEVDSDGDGVVDGEDAFPDDPTRSVSCPAGFYGDFSCTPAPPGSFVAEAGALAATPCAIGTYQPFAGSVSCDLAPPGTYVDVAGAVAATPCAVGTYQPAAGAISCLLAPLGTYVDSTGATAATACPAGTTTTVLGSTSSSACVPVAAVPVSTRDCKQNGWRSLTDTAGRPFRNQGDCVSFVATGGRNSAAD